MTLFDIFTNLYCLWNSSRLMSALHLARLKSMRYLLPHRPVVGGGRPWVAYSAQGAGVRGWGGWRNAGSLALTLAEAGLSFHVVSL